jgi:hypothetical protein
MKLTYFLLKLGALQPILFKTTLDPQHRLTPGQLARHPDAHQPFAGHPTADSVFTANPVGLGFVEHGYFEVSFETSIKTNNLSTVLHHRAVSINRMQVNGFYM